MSIERAYSYYSAVCDRCGNRLPGEETFMDAVRSKKRNGWKSRKLDAGEWEDICPDCQDEEGET